MIPHIGTPLPDRADRDWVTAHELAAEAGVDWLTVRHLTRMGDLFEFAGDRYSRGQIRRARFLGSLLNAGMPVHVIRDLIDDLLAHGHARLGHLTLTLDDDGQPDGTGAA